MIVSTSDDEFDIRIWNAITFEQIGQPINGFDDIAFGITISPDYETLVATSYSDPGYIKKWNLI